MYELMGKRFFDLTLSVFCLLILSPLLAGVAVLIRLEDGGPALFKQTRIGRDGREFTFLKYRSMPVNAAQLESAEADSLPITRMGRLIRRTNIDELPQLVNILKGDMSFVGPRPPLAGQEELVRMRAENGSLELRPGLTGLAQLEAYDGMPASEKAVWDGRYSSRVSFSHDMRIIMRTFGYLAKPPPTY